MGTNGLPRSGAAQLRRCGKKRQKEKAGSTGRMMRTHKVELRVV